jgi:archaellum component FlaC
MNNEPAHAEIAEDDNEPATKGDLREVETSVRTEIEDVNQRLLTVEDRLGHVEDRLGHVENRLGRVEVTTKRVLDIVQSIDKNTRGLPAKVERLHKAVFPHR